MNGRNLDGGTYVKNISKIEVLQEGSLWLSLEIIH
jgi:hypothetical protein